MNLKISIFGQSFLQMIFNLQKYIILFKKWVIDFFQTLNIIG